MKVLSVLSLKSFLTFARTLVLAGSIFSSEAFAEFTFSLPESEYINKANVSGLIFGGNCDVPNEEIQLIAPDSGVFKTPCKQDKTWAPINISGASWPEGSLTIKAFRTSAPGNVKERTFEKDTTNIPYVGLTSPISGTAITKSNYKNLHAGGTCIPADGETLSQVTVAISDSVREIKHDLLCDAMTWSFGSDFDVSELQDGTIVIKVIAFSKAGNSAEDTASYTKATIPPRVTLMGLPAKGINIANQAGLAPKGTCSSKGDKVVLGIYNDARDQLLQGPLVTTCSQDNKWEITNISVSEISDQKLKFAVRHYRSLTKEWSEEVTKTIVKDTTPPQLVLSSSLKNYKMNVKTGTKLTLSGNCTAGDGVVDFGVITKGSQNEEVFTSLATATCDSNGIFEAKDVEFGTQADGDVVVSVRQSDAVGNIGRQDASFAKKMTLPSVTITSNAKDGKYINIENQTVFLLSGSCSEYGGNAFNVRVSSIPAMSGGTLESQCLEVPNENRGRWELKLSVAELVDGDITFNAVTSDFVDNESPVVQLKLTKDTVPPLITFTKPSTQYKMNTETGAILMIAGTCSKSDLSVVIGTVANTVFSKLEDASCSTAGRFEKSINFKNYSDGVITIGLRQSDLAGNIASQDRSFSKKMTLPKVTISSNAKDGKYINSLIAPSFKLSGTCSEYGENGRDVQVVASPALPSQPFKAVCNNGKWELKLSVQNSDGSIKFSSWTTDFVDNVSAKASLDLIIDKTPPTLSITKPLAGFVIDANNQKAITFEGKCSDSVAMSGAASKTGILCSSGTWSYVLDASSLANGDLTFKFSSADVAGNAAEQSRVLKKNSIQVPEAPTNLAATAGENQVSLTWVKPAGGSAPTKYNVRRALVQTMADYVLVGSPTSTSFSDTSVTGGTTYYYAVTSVNEAGEGVSSAVVSATPIMDRPDDLRAIPDITSNKLVWQSVKGAQRYEIYRSLESGKNYKKIGTTGDLSFNDQGLTTGIVYYYIVKAFGEKGDSVSREAAARPENYKKTTVSSSFNFNDRICAVQSDGSIQCFGTYPGFSLSTVPNTGPGHAVFVSVSVGYAHSCGITDLGKVLCWGVNWYGELGTGDYDDRDLPTEVADSDQSVYVSVSPGGGYKSSTCAITSTGQVKCWGFNQSNILALTPPYNQEPEVNRPRAVRLPEGAGYVTALEGSYEEYGDLASYYGITGQKELLMIGKNRKVSNIDGVIDLSSGGHRHICALIKDGSVKCWGDNYFGALGTGNPTDIGKYIEKPTFVANSGPTGDVYTGIFAGVFGSCGLIGSSGQVKCWGSNNWGLLGSKGYDRISNTPVPLQGTGPSGLFVKQILIGHSTGGCLVAHSDPMIQCWGLMVGIPSPKHVDGTYRASAKPTVVFGRARTFTDFVLGSTRIAGTTSQGEILATGGGWNQLWYSPKKIGAQTDYEAVDLFFSSWRTSWVGLSHVGKVRALREDDPMKLVDQEFPGISEDFTLVSSGVRHWCGIRAQSAGVQCLANTESDFLPGYRESPKVLDIPNSNRFTALASSGGYDSFTCGLEGVTGKIFCWGHERNDEFGDGPEWNYTITPVPIADEMNFYVGIAAFSDLVCAITNRGAIYCWGDAISSNVPKLVFGGTDNPQEKFTSIAIASYAQRICGLIGATGVVKCWNLVDRWNRVPGLLGNGTFTGSNTPVKVWQSGSIDNKYIKIKGGQNNFCGLTDQGVIKCWGSNEFGQLGYDPEYWKLRKTSLSTF